MVSSSSIHSIKSCDSGYTIQRVKGLGICNLTSNLLVHRNAPLVTTQMRKGALFASSALLARSMTGTVPRLVAPVPRELTPTRLGLSLVKLALRVRFFGFVKSLRQLF